MPKPTKRIEEFIDDIPDYKLEGLRDTPGTIYCNIDFRVDMQGLTTGNRDWNLQIQVNKKCSIPSVRKLAPRTVAGPVLVSRKNPITPEEIRQAFKDSLDLDVAAKKKR
ncbi:hypothetical protein B0T17DRAFT_620765 [Bombardia bombarda]|uniref:Uncharacterized protein n=1 Tax=Bombardia bombarda TaxID=252184 RepID=A0AA39W4V2_9PEZI|nr:hypothetical protein B0T17DRAFT_620765 [Bombardia bombarda]